MGKAKEDARKGDQSESTSAQTPSVEEKDEAVQEEKEGSLNDPSKEQSSVPVSQQAVDATTETELRSSTDRDAVLARVQTEKRYALIKAWEENEKAKVENKAYKKLASIGSRENMKKASVEVQIKKHEEKLERKKAEYAEKMKNKFAEIHKAAEEKKAMIEAKRCDDFLKVEETAAKFRATGYTPKKHFGCFSC